MSVLFINRLLNTIVFQNLMDTPNTIFLCSSYADLFMVGISLMIFNCYYKIESCHETQ